MIYFVIPEGFSQSWPRDRFLIYWKLIPFKKTQKKHQKSNLIACWEPLGPSCSRLGSVWGCLGGVLARLGPSWRRLGSSWKRLASSCWRLGASWSRVGLSWASLALHKEPRSREGGRWRPSAPGPRTLVIYRYVYKYIQLYSRSLKIT